MMIRFMTPSVLAVLLSACTVSESSQTIDRAEAPLGLACPAQDFDAFLAAYADDVAVQKAFTKIPLRSETVDVLAEPEPKPISRMLTEAELRFPLMPSRQQQTRDGLKQSQSAVDDEQEVRLRKDDTDYQVSFFFRKEGCWILYRMRDDSL